MLPHPAGIQRGRVGSSRLPRLHRALLGQPPHKQVSKKGHVGAGNQCPRGISVSPSQYTLVTLLLLPGVWGIWCRRPLVRLTTSSHCSVRLSSDQNRRVAITLPATAHDRGEQLRQNWVTIPLSIRPVPEPRRTTGGSDQSSRAGGTAG